MHSNNKVLNPRARPTDTGGQTLDPITRLNDEVGQVGIDPRVAVLTKIPLKKSGISLPCRLRQVRLTKKLKLIF